jgi:putative two-component system response regulator
MGLLAKTKGASTMSGPDAKPLILVVDDEAAIRTAIGRILERADYVHFEASDPNTALGLADLYPFALVLCDVNMPGGSGLEMLRVLRQLHPNIAVVMVTGIADKLTAGRAAEFGAAGYVVKPFETKDLLATVASALEHRQAQIGKQTVRK